MAKALCESHLSIRLDILKKAKMLEPGLRSKPLVWNKHQSVSVISLINKKEAFIELLFRVHKKSETYIKHIQLNSTPCFLGGKRYWFNCPYPSTENPCNRRVSVLYLNDSDIGCRKCFDLLYKSQFEPKKGNFWLLDRLIRVSDYLNNKVHTRRTRFFEGKPTKYISKWLNKIHRIDQIFVQTGRSLDPLNQKMNIK